MLSPDVRAASRAARSSEAPAISRLDALVRIAQPFLQADDRLAACVKTKMPRLYNAGMDWADRNLMQPFSLGRQERVRRNSSGRWRSSAKRREDRPSSMVQPGPRIRRADRVIPEQIPYRALKANRWGVISPDRRKLSTFAGQAGDGEFAAGSIQQRHMDHASVAP